MPDPLTPDPQDATPTGPPVAPPTATPPGATPPLAPAAPDDWWTDQAEVPLTDAVAPAAAGRTWRTYAAVGVGAAALVIAGIVGFGAMGSKSPANSAAAANGTQTNGLASGQGAGPGGRFGRPGTRGTIASIDGSTITVNAIERGPDQSGGTQSSTPATTTVTVKATADTKVTETIEGTLADLAKGDNVLVVGPTTDGTVAASRITDNGDAALTTNSPGGGFPGGGYPRDGSGQQGSLPEGAPPGAVTGGGPGGFPGGGELTVGTVSAVDGSTLTVKTAAGDTVQVTTGSDTTVTVTKTISLADLAKGDTVSVMGTTSGTTVTAGTIRKGDEGFGRGGFPGGMPPGANGATPSGATDQTPTTI